MKEYTVEVYLPSTITILPALSAVTHTQHKDAMQIHVYYVWDVFCIGCVYAVGKTLEAVYKEPGSIWNEIS